SLSYFGTDQSQVGRYLSGKSVGQSRLGLLMNGILKVPMQFLILMIGALVFSFYQFNPAPIFFNDKQTAKVLSSPHAKEFTEIAARYDTLELQKKLQASRMLEDLKKGNEQTIAMAQENLKSVSEQSKLLRSNAIAVIKKADPAADTNDTHYIFLNFVLHYLPHGLIGLLIAVIFCASWNSTTAELNSLASTTVVDIYKPSAQT